MRDKERIPEMLKLLEEIWNENPDFRLGQLIVNACKPDTPCPQIFYIEDEVMKKKMEDLLLLMRSTRRDKS